MHGMIFIELKKFVESRLGAPAWKGLLKDAGLGSRVYIPINEYPDAEMLGLVMSAAKSAKQAPTALLEEFGEFIAPDLIAMYRSLVDPAWKTLEFLENTEQVIHQVVRLKNPGAKPPELTVARPAPDEAVITYTSARRMCGVAKGITRGVAKHYGETVEIAEHSCLLTGGKACRISVKLQR